MKKAILFLTFMISIFVNAQKMNEVSKLKDKYLDGLYVINKVKKPTEESFRHNNINYEFSFEVNNRFNFIKIDSCIVMIDESGQPILDLILNKKQHKGLDDFTTKNNQQTIAVIIDNTVLMTPKIMTPISVGHIMVTATLPKVYLDEISTTINLKKVEIFSKSDTFFDLFTGMLTEENGKLIFTKCNMGSIKMNIIDAFGNEDKKIREFYKRRKEKASKIMLQTKADVKEINEEYYIFIDEIIEYKLGESCLLEDFWF